MRVIGGNARGRRLKVPKGRALRPTAARVKEALFNILPHDLSGLRVLDLFAGSGNVTIEALSRGVKEAILVDTAVESGRAIRDNLRRLGLTERTRVLIMPVQRALPQLERQQETFDLIFVDPPYGQRLVDRTLNIVAQGSVLRDSGVIVAEHGCRDEIAEQYGKLELYDRRRYGDTILSFLRWQREKKPQARNSANGT
jgi:16S rRNA (guanine966-N2)-methyltransferase